LRIYLYQYRPHLLFYPIPHLLYLISDYHGHDGDVLPYDDVLHDYGVLRDDDDGVHDGVHDGDYDACYFHVLPLHYDDHCGFEWYFSSHLHYDVYDDGDDDYGCEKYLDDDYYDDYDDDDDVLLNDYDDYYYRHLDRKPSCYHGTNFNYRLEA
jgi:hypothetical protein